MCRNIDGKKEHSEVSMDDTTLFFIRRAPDTLQSSRYTAGTPFHAKLFPSANDAAAIVALETK